MTFFDFDSYYTNNLSSILPDGKNGAAITNASLSNPLTTTGDYCRRYYYNLGNSSKGEVRTQIKSSVNSGVFVDTSDDVSLSLRARVRLNNIVEGSVLGWVGVHAFSPIGINANNIGFSLLYGGYELVLEVNGTTPAYNLRIRAGNASSGSGVNNRVACSGTYAENTWYFIRMDIIPSSSSQKTVNAYTSSNNGSSWDLVGTFVVTSSDSYWRNTGYCGFSAGAFSGSLASRQISFYIDQFEAYSETIS